MIYSVVRSSSGHFHPSFTPMKSKVVRVPKIRVAEFFCFAPFKSGEHSTLQPHLNDIGHSAGLLYLNVLVSNYLWWGNRPKSGNKAPEPRIRMI